MRKIAIYGKGGIGKSTISSNLTAALSDSGVKVMQIGCDPKHDSTRMLSGGVCQETVLDYLKDVPQPERKLEDIVERGYRGCLCVEAGGPEPGIGCAGRGIISAFELLNDLGAMSLPIDLVLYDVLGDVVCGGFAVPLRNDYADTVYIVTSGEYMSIYAANNILKGTANYDPERIGGFIFNSRGDVEEYERVRRFSYAVGIPVVAEFSRSREFMEAERLGKTVVEAYPDSDLTARFRDLAKNIIEGRKFTAKSLSESELENVILGRSVSQKTAREKIEYSTITKKRNYSSRNVHYGEVLHGCAFSGAASVTLSIEGLYTVLHSPRSCTQFTFQLASNSIRRSMVRGNLPISSFADPMIHCTDMDETAMIFGGTEKLESDLERIIDEGNDSIALITSCPSGIIGDDVEGIIERIKINHPDVRIIQMMEDGNVRGDFMQGVIDASLSIVRNVTVKGRPKTDSVNLIGVKTMATNCVNNNTFVERTLEQMGIGINCKCVGDTTLGEIENLTAARMNILLTPDRFALMMKDFLIDEYALEFIDSVIRPGLKETGKWVMEVGKYFGKSHDAACVIDSFEQEYAHRVSELKRDLEGVSVYIVGTQKDIGWILEVMTHCNMNILRAVVIDLSDHSKDLDLDVDYDVELLKGGDMCTIVEDIISRGPDLIVTTYPIDVDGGIEQCFIPIAPDIGPYAGLDLAETWVKKLKAPRTEGWRNDIVRV